MLRENEYYHSQGDGFSCTVALLVKNANELQIHRISFYESSTIIKIETAPNDLPSYYRIRQNMNRVTWDFWARSYVSCFADP